LEWKIAAKLLGGLEIKKFKKCCKCCDWVLGLGKFGGERARNGASKPLEELAQDGRDIKRAARSPNEFLCCLATRSRAFCDRLRLQNEKA